MRKKEALMRYAEESNAVMPQLEALVDIRDILLWILKEMREANGNQRDFRSSLQSRLADMDVHTD